MTYLRNLSASGPQLHIISQHLDSVGDGTGTINGIGNYAGSALTLKITPPAGEIYRIARLIIHITDSGPVNDGSNYGNIAELTNGIMLLTTDAEHVDDDLTHANPIKSTLDWGRFCFDLNVTNFTTGVNIFQARWSFQKSGQYVRLVGDDNHSLKIVLNDNFTGLDDHTFLAQGYTEAPPPSF